MRYINALALRNGDTVIHKKTARTLRVLSPPIRKHYSLPANKPEWIAIISCVEVDTNIYHDNILHTEVFSPDEAK